jgi:hypothetical protein
LTEEWKESIIVSVYRKGDKTDCSNYRGISLLPATYKILSSILLSRLSFRENYWVSSMWISSNRSTTDHIYSAFIKYLRKKWEYSEVVVQLFIDFKKAYDSVRRKGL